MSKRVIARIGPAIAPMLQRDAARRLVAARHATGLTQERTAMLVGCDRVTVARRELAQVDLGALVQLEALESLLRSQKKAA
jgi:transcriptional regulator with XRE-family HTH domain